MSAPEQFTDTTKMARLWLHESERVYADRLVSAADLDMYNKKASQIAKKYFSVPDIDDYYKKNDPKPLIFCHFAQGLGEKSYNEVETYAGLYKTLIEALTEYNETNAVMDLVLFEDAMKHICRISRIISNPSGHALLVGVGGSGKQSLARLAAHICGFVTMMIVISGSYGLNAFKEDLQKMYRKSGQKGEGVMFLFTDSQVCSIGPTHLVRGRAWTKPRNQYGLTSPFAKADIPGLARRFQPAAVILLCNSTCLRNV